MNYKKQLVLFDTAKIINLSLILFLCALAVCLPINLLFFGSSPAIWRFLIEIIVVLAALPVLVVLHELLHAVGFLVFGGASFKDVRFGIILKHGMLYCSCKKPMTARAYSLALILPIIVTGIVPLIIVTFWGNYLWVALFAALVSGGAGDIIMFNSVRKLPPKQLVADHPEAPAYYIVYEEGKEPADFQEVTVEMETRIKEEMKKSPFEGENRNKNLAMKILKILLFLAASLVVLFIIGVVLKAIA